MKSYLINEQDIHNLIVEIENCVLATFEQKEVREGPGDENDDEPEKPERPKINYDNVDF